MAADLADIWQAEVRYIQGCCALQRKIDEHKNEELRLQEQVDRFINTRMDDFEEDDFQEIVGNLPEAAAAETAAGHAYEAFRALKRKLYCLLAYTQLRHNLHIDFVKTCSRQAQSGRPVTNEQRTVLLAYSSAPEYHIHTEHRPVTDERYMSIAGTIIIGYFELMNLELDVVTSVQTAVDQVVSLAPVEDRETPALSEGRQGIRRRRR